MAPTVRGVRAELIDGDGEQLATGSDEQSEGDGRDWHGRAACTVAAFSAEGMGAGERRWDGSTGRRSTHFALTPSSEMKGEGMTGGLPSSVRASEAAGWVGFGASLARPKDFLFLFLLLV